jgi:hypothetical protein
MTAVLEVPVAPNIRFAKLLAIAEDGADLIVGSVILPPIDSLPMVVSLTVLTPVFLSVNVRTSLSDYRSTPARAIGVRFTRVGAHADMIDGCGRPVIAYKSESILPIGTAPLTSPDSVTFDGRLVTDLIRHVPAVQQVPAQ